ncbi:taurine ABC transporter permease [Rhodobacteraceae bacterium EhC02]|jgi:taurine transport system permease protein|nr:ABC transporter permease subunit [Paracoccaceae bacterium]OAN72037.1 taurine ABC transporter permease [Rhodobacteraceae bacterium EhC02]
MIPLLIYLAIFIGSFILIRVGLRRLRERHDFTSLKTVTFGDESAVRADRAASIVSVLAIFLLWGAFTGSKWVPVHAPGPFTGEAQFTYTVEGPDGARDDATVFARVNPVGESAPAPEAAPGDGFARNDAVAVGAWRSVLVTWDDNDEITRADGASIVAIEGVPVTVGGTVDTQAGRVTVTSRGTLNYSPPRGLQMEPIWLPPPEAVVARVAEIAASGYQNFTLWEHLGWSLFRVIAGFVLGALVGIPLGYAMGLSDWFRGWFDPIVEFMRPVPPLALIPLVIIWAGIGEAGKIILLFLAALWIMTIAARAGVSGVAISKVHAAYSLGASKWQILRHVIVPNSLPEIFTGARVAMGVCWGTVVAAELVAAEKGAGMMIMVASRFQLTDVVIMGIILIGVIGYGIDILMRMAEKWLVPWKGRV